MAYATVFQDKV